MTVRYGFSCDEYKSKKCNWLPLSFLSHSTVTIRDHLLVEASTLIDLDRHRHGLLLLLL